TRRIDLVRTVVLPYQWEILNDRVDGAEKSYCVRNFRAAAGDIKAPHGGMVFQDSDLYKWLEAVAYTLAVHRDEALEKLADEAVELIVRAQEEDGYLNTYYSLMKPQKRYTNLMEGHEL
ncbi:glycoside hydrolase family 127 protein, partial [Escherichia coli]